MDPDIKGKMLVLYAYKKQTSPLSTLPLELVMHIFSYMPHSSFDARSTNRPVDVEFSNGFRTIENISKSILTSFSSII